jgi:PAS domain S-box-containing protein
MPSITTLLVLSCVALAGAGAFLAWAVRRARSGPYAPLPVATAPSPPGAPAMRSISASVSDLLFLVDGGGHVAWASPSAERALGARPGALQGLLLVDAVLETDRPATAGLLAQARAAGSARGNFRVATAPGELRAYEAVVDAVGDGGHGSVAVCGRDVTESLQRAEVVRHAQKLEAVGQLAAGVAHDFGNLLAVIRSGTALARESLPAGHPAHADLADVAAAADRGKALTRQILAVSRREPEAPARCDVGRVLAEMARYVPRVLGRGVQVHFVEDGGLGEVAVSATRLEQVVLNLVINARDAMPRGGWIRVEARRTDATGPDAGPGRQHVEIAVQDHGTGMTGDVVRRLFEPFFTTKEPGQGSGLGLATSLGIVEAAGGRIDVETEPGRGSIFRVRLPCVGERPARISAVPSAAVLDARRSRVLLVDHDPALVAILSRLLAARGHDVIAAASPMEARQQAASFPGAVDVVVTGLDLGDDHGVSVLGEVRRTSPRARAVLVAGEVAHDADVSHLLEAGVELVRRPAPPEVLVEVVERAAARMPVRREPVRA